MIHLKNKKNNLIVKATTLVMLATIIVVVAAAGTTIIGINRSADAFVIPGLGGRTDSKAPVVVSEITFTLLGGPTTQKMAMKK